MDTFLMPREVVKGSETLLPSAALYIALVLLFMSRFMFPAMISRQSGHHGYIAQTHLLSDGHLPVQLQPG